MDHGSAVFPGSRADVDDPVRRADRVFVVLDHDEGVAEVLELHQGLDEAPVVPLVQPDARLVEHVQHPGESGADLGGQTDALGLSSGQRARGPAQIQVIEPDLDEELQSNSDFAQYLRRDLRLSYRELHGVHEFVGVAEAELRDFSDVVVVHRHGQDLGLQPLSVADLAIDLSQIARVALASRIRLRLEVFPLDIRDDSLEAGRVLHLPTKAVLPLDCHLEVVAAENGLADLVGELPPRRREGEVEIAGQALEQPLEIIEQPLARLGPGQDDPVGEAQRRVAQQ